MTNKLSRLILLPCLLTMHYSISAQHVLNSELNLPRSGDVILKQQVEYKDPGRAGENVIWNFGSLQSVNDEYRVTYRSPYAVDDSLYIMGRDTFLIENLGDDEILFIGTERRTRYYYRFADSVLWTLGYENAATFLHYDSPLLTGFYPLNYGDSHATTYNTSAIYSMTVPYHESGTRLACSRRFRNVALAFRRHIEKRNPHKSSAIAQRANADHRRRQYEFEYLF